MTRAWPEKPRQHDERDAVRELWFRPVALEVFLGWLDGLEHLLRHGRDRASLQAADTHHLFTHDGWDEGLMHAVAERALADGVESLVIDGASFSGETPFFAFTERCPGRVTRTLQFDPLRGLVDDTEAIDAVLAKYAGRAQSLATMIRWGTDSRRHPLLGHITWDANSKPRWSPLEPRRSQAPSISFSAAVTLLCLAPVPLAVPFFFASFADGFELWPAVFSLGLVVWLALLPLRWPSGSAISWRARLLWFGLLPLLWSWVLMTVRSR